MNYLITGFPGMGKSTIARELKRRGHTAYDPEDMPAYMHIESRITGRHLALPKDVPRGWFDVTGASNWNLVKINKLLDSKDDVFICSFAHNQETLYDKFKLIFVLTLDDAGLMTRLRSRPGETIGKSSSELADILELHQHFEQHVLNRGAIPVHTARPVTDIVDDILRHVQSIV